MLLKSIAAITLIFYLSGASCRKKAETFYQGSIYAEKNNQTWNASIHANRSVYSPNGAVLNKFTFIADRYENGILREQLAISFIPLLVGNYRTFRNIDPVDTTKVQVTFSTISFDGDVLCDRYEIVESDSVNNFIALEQVNLASNQVAGKFSLHLSIVLPKCRSDAPDTLYFRNGVFSSKIQ
jgi:hypothetical protein